MVKKQAGIRRVHVIAHSMGNRVVAEALYARGQRAEPLVDQLVLAAPDVWASRFRNRFLRTLPNLAALDRSYLHAATPVNLPHATSAFPLLEEGY